jgi:hypothetical protein
MDRILFVIYPLLVFVCPDSLMKKKNELLVALATLWWISRILRSFYIRPDVMHRETLVLFTCTGRALAEVLFALVKFIFLSAIKAYIFPRADL